MKFLKKFQFGTAIAVLSTSIIVKYEDCATDCKFLVQRIEMFAGIGTHIDAPAHCFFNVKTVNDLSLQTLVSPCILINLSQDADEKYLIGIETIKNFERKHSFTWKNAFVIFYTGWDRFWSQSEEYRNNYHFPSLSKEVAEYLVAQNILGIGINTLSPDLPESGYSIHQIVLGARNISLKTLLTHIYCLLPVVMFLLCRFDYLKGQSLLFDSWL